MVCVIIPKTNQYIDATEIYLMFFFTSLTEEKEKVTLIGLYVYIYRIVHKRTQ